MKIIYLYIPVYFFVKFKKKYIPVYTGIRFWRELYTVIYHSIVYTSIYWYILVYTMVLDSRWWVGFQMQEMLIPRVAVNNLAKAWLPPNFNSLLVRLPFGYDFLHLTMHQWPCHSAIWNPNQLYEIMVFRASMYVLVYTEYVLVKMVHTCMYWYIPSMYWNNDM